MKNIIIINLYAGFKQGYCIVSLKSKFISGFYQVYIENMMGKVTLNYLSRFKRLTEFTEQKF